jgi:hypothetical protein
VVDPRPLAVDNWWKLAEGCGRLCAIVFIDTSANGSERRLLTGQRMMHEQYKNGSVIGG